MNRSSMDEQIRYIEETLAQACDAAPGSLEDRMRAELELRLAGIFAARLRKCRTRHEAIQATRLKCQVIEEGRMTAIQLRSLIRAKLGPYDARLKEFGIAPLKGRRRA